MTTTKYEYKTIYYNETGQELGAVPFDNEQSQEIHATRLLGAELTAGTVCLARFYKLNPRTDQYEYNNHEMEF